ncbi:universal stress protein [Actinacidiphila glaucinigra]|uniref:universal stress protein n=1 Tax=Actinacidiphila glaucinigra TaxID=235986 RepID=UPI003D93FFD7
MSESPYRGASGAGPRVVVGLSGSPGSLAALHRAVAEARSRSAGLLAVLAWEPPPEEFAHRRTPLPPRPFDWEQEARERLRAALRAAFGADAPPGMPDFRAGTGRGSAGYVLVKAAARAEDLLVVGTGSRGLLPRALRGSVARYCVAHAACPVLAVPPSRLPAGV